MSFAAQLNRIGDLIEQTFENRSVFAQLKTFEELFQVLKEGDLQKISGIKPLMASNNDQLREETSPELSALANKFLNTNKFDDSELNEIYNAVRKQYLRCAVIDKPNSKVNCLEVYRLALVAIGNSATFRSKPSETRSEIMRKAKEKIQQLSSESSISFFSDVKSLTKRCFRDQRFLIMLHDEIIQVVQAVMNSKVVVPSQNQAFFVERLAFLTDQVAKELDKTENMLNVIHFALIGNEQIYTQPSLSGLRQFAGLYTAKALTRMLKNPNNRKQIDFFIIESASEFLYIHQIKNINTYKFAESKCAIASPLDFSSPVDSIRRSNRLLAFEFFDGLLTNAFRCQISQQNQQQLAEHLDYIFAISQRELSFLKIVTVYQDYLEFFFDGLDASSKHAAISSFNDVLHSAFL